MYAIFFDGRISIIITYTIKGCMIIGNYYYYNYYYYILNVILLPADKLARFHCVKLLSVIYIMSRIIIYKNGRWIDIAFALTGFVIIEIITIYLAYLQTHLKSPFYSSKNRIVTLLYMNLFSKLLYITIIYTSSHNAYQNFMFQIIFSY